MLLQFKVANFLSYDNEQTLNMISGGEEVLASHEVEVNGTSILKSAALYGSNASGKSNLIKSIDFARSIVLNSRVNRIVYSPFKLSNLNKNPSSFQFVFEKNEVIYDYGFTINRDQILDEWLYKINDHKEMLIFERKTDDLANTTVKVSNLIFKKGSLDRQKFDVISETIGKKQKRQLLLSKLGDNNLEIFESIIEWFKDIVIIYPETKFDIVKLKINEAGNEKFLNFLSESMNQLGTGVSKISFVEEELEIESMFNEISNEAKNKLLEVVSNIEEDSLVVVEMRNRRYILRRIGNNTSIVKLVTQHQIDDGDYVDFELNEESDGTQRLFDLLPMLFDLASNNRIYLIDELDRSLHTILTTNLLKRFLNNDSNEGDKSQIIFTTHDTNLMDLLRDDEIWLVQKFKNHSSVLSSLYEFDIDEKVEKMKGYLNGRFGGIPSIKEVWSK